MSVGVLYIRGADGKLYPIKTIRGLKGEPGNDGISVTHEWDGTVLKVTSASGTSSADLKGNTGEKGDTGTSVTVKSVSESTEDGGSNVVEFSDGTTLTVKNGNTGAAGATAAEVLAAMSKETWTFTLVDGSTVTKEVPLL